MDELGFNKLAAAILATALGYMGIKEISHAAMHVSAPDIPAYALELPEPTSAGEEEIEPPFPSLEWVSAMDTVRGEKVFKKCLSCHNAENGGAHGTGPNLWNVVGASSGQHADFKYSSALLGSGIQWNYAELDGFLKKPGKYLKGTNMNFIGLKKSGDRAAVIEYLRIASATPVEQPEPAALPDVAEANEAVTGDMETTIEGAPSNDSPINDPAMSAPATEPTLTDPTLELPVQQAPDQ